MRKLCLLQQSHISFAATITLACILMALVSHSSIEGAQTSDGGAERTSRPLGGPDDDAPDGGETRAASIIAAETVEAQIAAVRQTLANRVLAQEDAKLTTRRAMLTSRAERNMKDALEAEQHAANWLQEAAELKAKAVSLTAANIAAKNIAEVDQALLKFGLITQRAMSDDEDSNHRRRLFSKRG